MLAMPVIAGSGSGTNLGCALREVGRAAWLPALGLRGWEGKEATRKPLVGLGFLGDTGVRHSVARMSRIAVFGAGGRAGQAAVAEALQRGHNVTAVVREPSRYTGPAEARVVQGDVLQAQAIEADAVISAVHQPGHDFFVRVAKALNQLAATRIVVVGLASILPTADGTLLMDTAGYPQEYRDFYLAHAAGVAALGGGDWVVVSPAGDFDHGGPRSGRYAVTDADAAGRVSYADLAVALLDEIEEPRHRRVHIGVSWCAGDGRPG
ncbi:hypothetical protein AFR_31455 [Actinoplanes friuliensis DSM 7358]|uniref:NAD(P)-binding domain-containing protein n=2 Tax=Actinoplanes friuliensis TaxID=196914 RepID=U5W9H1_9ACTN|nr:hypothetical protein AFR_31455 [Actinoplanes friuliensis DSM 7358]